MKLRVIFTLTLLVFVNTHAFAKSAVSLPDGDLIAYGGANCGLIRGTWYAGQILGDGGFVSLSSKLTKLKKKLKRTTGAAKKKKIRKAIKKLKSNMETDAAICLQLDSKVKLPVGDQTPATGATTIDWNDDLLDTSYTTGDEVSFFCPPNGSYSPLYGTFIYTDDSAICFAAVHAGIISLDVGGNVKIRVKSGQSSYTGSLRNSIESYNYGSYERSYIFLHPDTGEEVTSNAPPVITWGTSATFYKGKNGLLLTYLCPANGSLDTIYGTDIYTDDSGICTAAVHANKISLLQGGLVRVRISAGLSSYAASTRNGVTSYSYGSWDGSFSLE